MNPTAEKSAFDQTRAENRAIQEKAGAKPSAGALRAAEIAFDNLEGVGVLRFADRLPRYREKMLAETAATFDRETGTAELITANRAMSCALFELADELTDRIAASTPPSFTTMQVWARSLKKAAALAITPANPA